MLTHLANLPPGIEAAAAITSRIDALLCAGLSAGRRDLASFRQMITGTPLETACAAGLAALERGIFEEQHMAALAAVRTAIQGACYDSLRNQVRTALGRPVISEPAPSPVASLDEPLLAGVRHWLMELAVTGFARLDHAAVLPFLPTLAEVRRRPALARTAFLLTGFVGELLERLPFAYADDVPQQRWGDLWSSALIGAPGSLPIRSPQPVSGILYPLGVALHEQPQTVSVTVYAVLVYGGIAEFVRITRARFKVEAIAGSMNWLLFPEFALLLDALTQGQALSVTDMLLLPGGDLLWDAARVAPGLKAKGFEAVLPFLAPDTANPAITAPLPPLERHPIQLAEPVVLSGISVRDTALVLDDGTALPLDYRRWAVDGELGLKVLNGMTVVFGLLRYDDGRWFIQPLSAANRAGKITFIGQAGAQVLKKPPKQNPLPILNERASRLLRKG